MGVDISTPPAIPHGTYYWSAPGLACKPEDSTKAWDIADFGWRNKEAGDAYFMCPVYLPDGAVVIAAVVYSDDDTYAWTLWRASVSDSSVFVAMAGAGYGAEDTTITNPTIDNSLYAYSFTGALHTNKRIHGARITYTL